MLIIGVVGGIASGKSLVARQLAELGAGLLDADQAGHAVLREPDVQAAIRARFGPAVFDATGEINRPRLAAIVFAPPPEGPTALFNLEQITHPRIGVHLQTQIERLAARNSPAAVLDAAVMAKSGWHRLCDRILFVDAPRELRLARARTRGWSDEEFARREAAQESLDAKRQLADTVIDNRGSPEETRRQVEAFWRSLGLPRGRSNDDFAADLTVD